MSHKPCNKDTSYDYLGLVLLLTELPRALCVPGNHAGWVSNLLRGRGTVWEEAIFSRLLQPSPPPPPLRYKRQRPSPRYIWNQDGCPQRKALDLDDFTKKGDCEQHWGKHAQKRKLAIHALSNILSVARENTQHTQRALSLGLKSSLPGNSDSSSNFYNNDGTQILLF